jgi:hypothetical protein
MRTFRFFTDEAGDIWARNMIRNGKTGSLFAYMSAGISRYSSDEDEESEQIRDLRDDIVLIASEEVRCCDIPSIIKSGQDPDGLFFIRFFCPECKLMREMFHKDRPDVVRFGTEILRSWGYAELVEKWRDLEDVKLIGNILEKNMDKPISEFQGRFHHLRFDWRAHADERGFVNPVILSQVLCGIDPDEKEAFTAQIMRCIVRGDLPALYDAAFGIASLSA